MFYHRSQKIVYYCLYLLWTACVVWLINVPTWARTLTSFLNKMQHWHIQPPTINPHRVSTAWHLILWRYLTVKNKMAVTTAVNNFYRTLILLSRTSVANYLCNYMPGPSFYVIIYRWWIIGTRASYILRYPWLVLMIVIARYHRR